MFLEPLVDLWRRETAGFVLVDAKGELYRATYPGELYAILHVVVSEYRQPLVLIRPVGLQEDALWGEYLDRVRKELCKDPQSLRLWEVIETGERKGEAWNVVEQKRMLTAGKAGPESWVAKLKTVEERDRCLREGHRYAAGPVFGKPEPIPIPDHITHWRFF